MVCYLSSFNYSAFQSKGVKNMEMRNPFGSALDSPAQLNVIIKSHLKLLCMQGHLCAVKRKTHIVRSGVMENGKIGRFEDVRCESYRHLVTQKIGRTAYVIWSLLSTSGLIHFLGKSGSDNFLVLIRKRPILEAHKWANPSKMWVSPL